MVAASNGDRKAFVALYLRYRLRIHRFCKRFIYSDAEAEEAAQDVFTKIYASRARYQPRGRFSLYIYRVALNHCLNIRDRKLRRITSPAPDMEKTAQSPRPSPSVLFERKRLRKALTQSLGTIPARQAAALMLCHVWGLNSQEAAEVMQSSSRAIKSLVHRARRHLRDNEEDALIGTRGWMSGEDS